MNRSLVRHAAASAVALLVSVGFGHPQDFPVRPVTLIVPFAAGGTTDIGLRALAAATERHLGQSIVIENRAGAGGVLGPLQMATNSAPDRSEERRVGQEGRARRG